MCDQGMDQRERECYDLGLGLAAFFLLFFLLSAGTIMIMEKC